jgi:hypothetical protein
VERPERETRLYRERFGDEGGKVRRRDGETRGETRGESREETRRETRDGTRKGRNKELERVSSTAQ